MYYGFDLLNTTVKPTPVTTSIQKPPLRGPLCHVQTESTTILAPLVFWP